MAPRKILATPAFCRTGMIRGLFEWLKANPPGYAIEHHVIDGHYPLNQPGEIESLCLEFGAIYHDPGADLGLHKNLNFLLSEESITADDTFVGLDPDDRPSTGLVDRLAAAHDPARFAVTACNFWVIDQRKQQGVAFQTVRNGGHEIWIHPHLEMWSACLWNMKVILGMGGFSQPNLFYGGIEVAMVPAMHASGLKLAYVADVRSDEGAVDREDRNIFDPEYGAWKIDHATKGYRGGFAQYLAERGRLAKGTP